MSTSGDEGSETLISKLDFGDPLYLHASDITSVPLITIKLKDTENYKVWCSAMTLALQIKNKWGFIDKTCIKDTQDDVLAVVWQELKETYDKLDCAVIFNVYQKINTLTQSGATVSEYYNKLNSYWKQFDALVKLPPCTCGAASCSCDASKGLTYHVSMIKLMQFLMDLDDIYAPIRSHILTSESVPSVRTAFAIISREESHKGIGLKTVGNSSAFVTQFQGGNSNTVRRFGKGPNPNFKCSHCSMNGHTVDRCFELIGYPPGQLH
ncbi:uncharacterized protein [Rutidosis leptorrhynchoides]|uniref:uncharacterized protein n=1 Tax=Rutidosis leptorrhynchoides TaxID=125765 RepID=UPI003A9994A3